MPEKEFLKAFKTHPRLKTKVNNFHRQMASNNNSEEDFVPIRPEWTTVDRILACRFDHLKVFVITEYKMNCAYLVSDCNAFEREFELNPVCYKEKHHVEVCVF